MTNDLSDYSAVIIEYFSGEHLAKCLTSLEQQSHQPEKIVVVVNGIEEKKIDILRKEFSSVHFILPNSNLGYSKAINLGVGNTLSGFILVLNPDTVLDVDFAKLACGYLSENDSVAAIGPQIREANGEIYPSARNEPNIIDAVGHGLLGMFKPNNKFTRRYKNLDLDPNETREVDWLSGAAQFQRRKALDDVGGWDEDFFMYCEDIDLGRRFRLRGWKNIYLPESKIQHIQGISTDRAPLSLVVAHHKSLLIYSKKKYGSNPIMRIMTGIFIVIRLPVALVSKFFRIN